MGLVAVAAAAVAVAMVWLASLIFVNGCLRTCRQGSVQNFFHNITPPPLFPLVTQGADGEEVEGASFASTFANLAVEERYGALVTAVRSHINDVLGIDSSQDVELLQVRYPGERCGGEGGVRCVGCQRGGIALCP